MSFLLYRIHKQRAVNILDDMFDRYSSVESYETVPYDLTFEHL